MTDFIDHLISRSLAGARSTPGVTLLQPRLPSIFETMDFPAAVSENLPRQKKASSETVERTNPPDLPNISEEKGIPVLDSSVDSLQESIPLIQSLMGKSDVRPISQNDNLEFPSKDGIEEGNPQLAREASGLENRNDPKPLMEMTPQIISSPTRIDKQEAAKAGKPPHEEVRPLIKINKSDPAKKAAKPIPVSIPVAMKRYASLPSGPPAGGVPILTEGIPQTPEIRVHIGRIDVRAMTPPPVPPTRLPASKRPRLTLEEYIHRRDEGKR